MPRDISQTMRDQVYSTEMQFVALVVLDISDNQGNVLLRVVNNNEDIAFEAQTYEACAFNFTPPGEQDGEVETATLTISNIDRRIVTIIRSIQERIHIKAQIVLVAGASVEREAGPWEFNLSNVQYNAETVSGTLAYDFFNKQILSNIRYNISNFPSLVVR